MSAQIELWKDIEGYEGKYQVSNMGRVKSLDRIIYTAYHGEKHIKGVFLQPKYTKDGYQCVSLNKNGVENTQKVHRIVAKAFSQNPNNYPEVNHLDGIKTNNAVSNLEWCTHKMNMIHARATGLVVDRPHGKPTSNKTVVDTTTGKTYPSIKAAAFDMGLPKATLYKRISKSYATNTLMILKTA